MQRRTSATQRLAELALEQKNTTLQDFIANRRAAGSTWRAIARDLWTETDGIVDVSDVTVRSWSLPVEAAK